MRNSKFELQLISEEILKNAEIGKKVLSDKAKSLRQGKQSEFTIVIRTMILLCLHSDNKEYSEKTAMALIQPLIFKKIQTKIFNWVFFEPELDKCIDSKLLVYIDRRGKLGSIKIRSLENMVSKLRKIRLNKVL